MSFSAVVVAAGAGLRAGPGEPKAWRTLGSRPLIRWSVEGLLAAGAGEGVGGGGGGPFGASGRRAPGPGRLAGGHRWPDPGGIGAGRTGRPALRPQRGGARARRRP